MEKDVEQRQQLIDRLLLELDQRQEAIQKLGLDCISLRQQNQQYLSEIENLEGKLAESDLKTSRLINTFDIDIIPPSELQRRYALLSAKLEQSLQKVAAYQDKVQELEEQNKKAHTAQQSLVLSLQKTVQDYQKCKSVVTKQEQVIAQLEDSLAANQNILSAVEDKSDLKESKIYKALSDENKVLRLKLKEIQEGEGETDDPLILKIKLKRQTERAKALEAQMIVGAKSSGRQIGELKKKLRDLSMKLQQ
ncbi:hypothetical protein HDV01_000574 [Terramyces sp. JEL0728]|nr:hypothetical protein HDV01_000574 [Terramyces sp. JEL0728]